METDKQPEVPDFPAELKKHLIMLKYWPLVVHKWTTADFTAKDILYLYYNTRTNVAINYKLS